MSAGVIISTSEAIDWWLEWVTDFAMLSQYCDYGCLATKFDYTCPSMQTSQVQHCKFYFGAIQELKTIQSMIVTQLRHLCFSQMEFVQLGQIKITKYWLSPI